MSPISQTTFSPSTVSLKGATESVITNKAITLANTEYAHTLQTDVKQIRIRCREVADLKYSFVVTESGTKYWSIPKGCVDNITDISFTGKILYLQSSKASVIVEIAEFY